MQHESDLKNRPRYRRLLAACRAVALAAGLFATLAGCATIKEERYFAVSNPTDPKETNYYKVSIKGNATLAKKYKVRAGYVGVATVDAMMGEDVTVPVTDLAPEDYKDFHDIKANFRKYLVEQSELATVDKKAPKPRTGDQEIASSETPETSEINRKAVVFGTLGQQASLSDTDFRSIGQKGSSDPYDYRKLVFYVTAEDFNLKDYQNEISAALKKTEALGQALRQRREEAKTKAAAETAAKQDAMRTVLPKIIRGEKLDDDQSLAAFMQLLLGIPPAKATADPAPSAQLEPAPEPERP